MTAAEPKKRKLTEDEKLRRRAARKAEAINQRLRDDVGPLFIAEIPKDEFTNATDQYWVSRRAWASGKGEAFAELDRFDRQMNLWLVRCVARKHMTPADFEICDSQRWTGDIMKFWRDVLTGQKKMPIGWNAERFGWKPVFRDKDKVNCCGHGCHWCESVMIGYIEQTTMTVALEWPAPGFVAPLTADEYDRLTTIPDCAEHPDGLALHAEVSRLLERLGLQVGGVMQSDAR